VTQQYRQKSDQRPFELLRAAFNEGMKQAAQRKREAALAKPVEDDPKFNREVLLAAELLLKLRRRAIDEGWSLKPVQTPSRWD
jgi:hypothetical protein